jgi:Mg-chelatase subunit ChlD
VLDALARLLEHPDPAPRVHAWEALTRLTRAALPADAAAWRAWLDAHPDAQAHCASAQDPAGAADDARYEAPTPLHVPHYYGIPIARPRSHVVFCLDISQSMYGRGIEQARGELERTLRDLPTTTSFEVIAFNERVLPLFGALVPAHPVVKSLALTRLAALETLSYTNLYDAVELAFGYGGIGDLALDRPERLDAIFLLSDGAPNRGRFRREARVVRAIADLSRGRVPVHCVAAGEEVFPLLQRIASATGGRFVDAFDFE